MNSAFTMPICFATLATGLLVWATVVAAARQTVHANSILEVYISLQMMELLLGNYNIGRQPPTCMGAYQKMSGLISDERFSLALTLSR
jgi:hypothetical protein